MPKGSSVGFYQMYDSDSVFPTVLHGIAECLHGCAQSWDSCNLGEGYFCFGCSHHYSFVMVISFNFTLHRNCNLQFYFITFGLVYFAMLVQSTM